MLDALFPLTCTCGARAGIREPLCATCVRSAAPAVGAPPPSGIDAWWAAFAYDGPVREVVARAKYRGVRATVPWLAAALGDVLLERGGAALAGSDVVTWAPTTPDHRRRRGFDPAEVLARALARHLGLRPVATLVRAAGPPQTGRSAVDRRRGPSFRARGAVPAGVLVVDDVATTGATLAAAARALRAGGAGWVWAATAARTPAPGSPSR